MDTDAIIQYAPTLLLASLTTLRLAATSAVLGTAVGLACALLQLGGGRGVVALVRSYIWVMRGLPPLLVIMFAYYALPSFSIELEPFVAATLAIAASVGAFWAEVFRAGIAAIPGGQWDAARALGLGVVPTLRHVVLPQAFRVVLPPYINGLVSLVKETSLASAITVVELTLASQRAYSASFRPVEILTMTGLLYLAMTSVLMAAQAALERRLRGPR